MYAGRPVEIGTVDEVFYQPRMPYTIGLLGAMPRLGAPDGGKLVPVPGNPPSLINLAPGLSVRPGARSPRRSATSPNPSWPR